MKVFIDECGDLGFSVKATRYFVVGFLMLDNEWRIDVDFRRLLRRLREKRKYKHDEFKFSKASDKIRKEILEKLCGYGLDFGFVVLRKSKVHARAHVVYFGGELIKVSKRPQKHKYSF